MKFSRCAFRARLLVLGTLLLFAGPAPGGEKAKPSPDRPLAPGVQRERVYLIQLNLVVTDRDGRFVSDLRREDLSLLVDGSPMKIEAVDLEVVGPGGPPVGTTGGAGPAVETPPGDREQPPTLRSRGIILFFDGVNGRRGLGPEAIESARRFLHQGLPPGDEVMVVGLGRRFRVYQPFTTDGLAVLSALDRVEADDQLRRGGQERTKDNLDLIKELEDFLSDAPGPAVALPPMALRETFARDERDRGIRFLEALQALSDIVRPREGRKEVFLFSDGLPMNPEAFYGVPQAWGLEDLVLRTAREASEARVVLNPVSTRGLPALGNLDTTLERQSTATLGALALGTGGSLIQGVSDHFEQPMRKVEEQTRSGYLLSFVPRGAPDGKLHSTRITVERKGVVIRAPEGYLYLTVAQRRQRETLSAYAVPESFSELPVAILACSYLEESGKPAVEMAIEFPESSLLLLPRKGRRVARLEAGFVVTGEDGKVRDRLSRSVEARLGPDGPSRDRVLTLLARRSLDAGDYDAVAVVRDLESGVVGARRFPIQVPALASDHIAMSSLVLTRPVSAVQPIRLDDRGGGRNSPVVPSVGRIFSSGESISGFALIYHPRRDADRGEIRVLVRGWLRRGNEEIRQFPILRHRRPAPERLVSIPAEFPLDLVNLEPGRYELEVEAWDEVEGRGVRQSAEFLVR